jgi:protein tyrosine/serine phosphatase
VPRGPGEPVYCVVMVTPLDPDCYWVVPGTLLAGEYPSARDEATSRRKIAELLDAGIRTFIDLTEERELPGYAESLAAMAEARGVAVTYQRLPIVDMDVPSVSQMRSTLTAIEHGIAAAAPVYVHCWGGIGRTGTVIGCWLVEHGRTGESALAELDVLRGFAVTRNRPSPEMPDQLAFVRSWAPGGGA